MDKLNQLTRVCSSCGIKKPLSAFLHLGGQGTTYGAICSDCRRAGLGKPVASKEDKEKETTSSGFRIGAKQKVFSDLQKQRQFQDLKETYRKDFLKRENFKSEKLFNTESIQKAEKQHRKFYIEAKKQGFLAGSKTPESKQKQVAEKAKVQFHEERAQQEKTAHVTETKRREDLFDYTLKMTTVDFTVPYLDPQFTEIRYHNPVFLRFKQWLGSSAPMAKQSILKALEKMYNKDSNQVKQELHGKTSKEKVSKELGKEKDVLLEYIDKTWGVTSRKR